jgi:ATP-dependent Clp protease protease subunit
MAETPDTTKIQSKYHSLFIEQILESKKKKKEKNTFEIKPAHSKFRMFIDSFAEDEKGLHEILNILWGAKKYDTLELRINSGGGFIKEGQQLANVIQNKFHNRTTTVLDSAAYSMGAITFCLGDTRVVTENCDLMFHDFSIGLCGKGQEIEAQVEHNKTHLRNFFKKILVPSGYLTEFEFEQMIIGKDFWMDVTEMCERGIATHVLVKGENIKAKNYLTQIKNKNVKTKKRK